MSVYSTVPNCSIFFKQDNQNARALTPPNTPTHGVIISTFPMEEDLAPDEEPGAEEQLLSGEPKAYLLMNNNDYASSAQSTPDMCGTPDSQEPWQIPSNLSRVAGPKWRDLDTKGKLCHVGNILAKIGSLLGLLYIFICSLDLLSTAFRLLGARLIGNFFTDNHLVQNPVVGLMIGVLVTVLLQSSSTSSSIAVTMVASRIIRVRQAIPIIMGANIGTSVTNTIVSLMQSADREEFGRAFAAATVHDMFNWLTVLVLLPLEMTTRYLERITTWMMEQSGITRELHPDHLNNQTSGGSHPKMLNELTKPLTKLIIQIDSKLLEQMAYGNQTITNTEAEHSSPDLLIRCCPRPDADHSNSTCQHKCSLFGWLSLSDTGTGLLLLMLSILVLCLCLMMLVKLLNSMLTGQIAKLIKQTVNRSYSFPYSMLADYLAILIGCLLTILVQSSSIFTSALTPLAGIGVISLERMYPLTLGANIGTTTTGILAALAAESTRLHDTLQIAFCHLFFNLTGILLFYPIPVMRFPIPLARKLGSVTATYRWFSIFYLLVMFFLLPLFVFTLSTLGSTVMLAIGGPMLLSFVLVILVNLVQRYHSSWLPPRLRNWHFLPLWMRSLDPLDALINKLSKQLGCGTCCVTSGQLQHIRLERGHDSGKLGHHSDTHHSRLHILGAMYQSNSQSNFGEYHNQMQERDRVNDTIKKVIGKLAWQGSQLHHTVHNCSQMHRYYPSANTTFSGRRNTRTGAEQTEGMSGEPANGESVSPPNETIVPLTIDETKML